MEYMVAYVAGAAILLAVVAVAVLKVSYVKVPAGKALVVDGPGKVRVHFAGAFVNPLSKREFLDLTMREITLSCKGEEALPTRDRQMADA